MRRFILILTLFLGLQTTTSAVEGMWIPSLIDMFYGDMQTYGLKLSQEDIYSTNNASLKDAIVQFNGGCTAEIVSNEGLILTNHHCGFSAIQHHSSLENDYLKNGFWAKNKEEELACPWLRVTFVKEISDVTGSILGDIADDLSPEVRQKIIDDRIAEMEKMHSAGNLTAKIKPFNLGNEYFMLLTEDYNDIRLVGAPPSAIGKFGGDTDNWVWPRHTGDFSVFRIYANSDNESAPYDEANQPFAPVKSLPISLKPKQEGDFTMVYGFPGSTDQHYVSGKLNFYINTERPARIAMRQQTLDILKPAMNGDDQIRIQYASKQARIANAWKKWIGQVGGLKDLRAVDKKLKWEEKYRAKAAEKTSWKQTYFPVVGQLNELQEKYQKYEFARALYIEYFYVGPEFIQHAFGFYNLAYNYEKLKAEGKLEAEIEKLERGQKGFFKNYNKSIDQKIFNALTPLYIAYADNELLPNNLATDWEKQGELIFNKSAILQIAEMNLILKKFDKKAAEKLKKDPALVFAKDIYEAYIKNVSAPYNAFMLQEEALMKTYVAGLLEMFPDKRIWADANSTMRIAYGKLEGSSPVDGLIYAHYTTIDGIMQKYNPENPDFQLTPRFLQLYEEGDYGDYAQDGELWVCFTASNHTTGGNSGSPVIDAEGELNGH